MSQLADKLRALDAYPKTLEDYSKRSYGGAAVTLISIVVMTLLTWSEFNDYWNPSIREELFVDTSRSPHIQINIDIVFPRVSCDFLSLDAMDSSGDQHLQIDHVYKRKLDLEGRPIEEPVKLNLTETTTKPTDVAVTTTPECGSCYGARDGCCNTCDEVREAYAAKRWAFPDFSDQIVQCKGERTSEKLNSTFLQGCQIYGNLIVNKVSGSFHVAPGKSFSVNHVHVHDVQPFSSSSFNTTHVIRHLTFGTAILSDRHDPMKDTVSVAEQGGTMFQYHLKIVPNVYVKLRGDKIDSFQFSVTKHKKVVSVTSGESAMPGAFFQYELSPLMVKTSESRKSFGHFATNLCAIVGGVYTVTGLLYTLFDRSIKIMQKVELGKLN